MIHEPSRLAVMTILRRTAGADFLFIRRLTGLSKGNLSNHLAKLEEAGLVNIGKHFEGKKPVTTVNLTKKGRATIEAYWAEMERIAADNRRPSPKAAQPSDAPSSVSKAGDPYGGAASA
jgi:DNA-binding MarR family transcriptional regulator